MPYRVTSGIGAGNQRFLAGEVSICPTVASQFLFLLVTLVSTQGLPVCLLGGGQPLTLHPSGPGTLSQPRSPSGVEGMSWTSGLLLKAPSGQVPCSVATVGGRTYKVGVGPSFRWRRRCMRGLACI